MEKSKVEKVRAEASALGGAAGLDATMVFLMGTTARGSGAKADSGSAWNVIHKYDEGRGREGKERTNLGLLPRPLLIVSSIPCTSSSIVIPHFGLLGWGISLSSTLPSITRLMIPSPRLLLPPLGPPLLPPVIPQHSPPPPLLQQLLLALHFTFLGLGSNPTLVRLNVGDSLLQLLAQFGDGRSGSIRRLMLA